MLSNEEKQFINEHLSDDVNRLALSGVDSRLLVQISGRQKIKTKVPSWYLCDDLLYPPKLSLEQSSSEATAHYKSSLLKGDSLVDLTGGFGVDTAFISPSFADVTYVERQTELCEIVSHNFPVLGLGRVKVCNADSESFVKDMPPVDCIYLDPARRSDSGKKIMRIHECKPNLLEIQDLLIEKSNAVLVKFSPMLDIKSALQDLKNVSEVHVVSVENECKELLFLLKKEPVDDPLITCVNLLKDGACHALSFTYNEEKEAGLTYTNEVKQYLYEPNASMLKSGFYKGTALMFDVKKLHPDSHLYTSDKLVSDFPGRIFKVDRVSGFNKAGLKDFAKNVAKANLSTRNFPLKTDELRSKLKIKEGGDVYVFATTLSSGMRVLISTSRI